VNADCANVIGSYICTCKDGYEGTGDPCSGFVLSFLSFFFSKIFIGLINEYWIDINECLDQGGGNNCDLNAICENTQASFTCTCNDGYDGDGVDCNGIFFIWYN